MDNNINFKDVIERQKDKEYSFPPLPNLVTAKNEYVR